MGEIDLPVWRETTYSRSDALAGVRIILADTDTEKRTYIRHLLVAHEGEVIEAADGKTAIDLVLAHQPDLVLIDATEFDGYGMLQAIRSDSGLKTIPVILLSDRDDIQPDSTYFDTSADFCLTTPFSPRELLVVMDAQLKIAKIRREHQKALQQGMDRFRTFIDQSLDGIIIIDNNGNIIEWNPAEEEMTGIPRSEAIGRPLWDVQYRLAPADRRTPEFLRMAREKIVIGMGEGTSLKRLLEDEIELRDGTRRVLQSVVFIIRIGDETLAGGISRDITERKKIECILQDSEERFRAFFEGAGVGTALIDPDLRFNRINSVLCRITGYSRDELMRMTPLDLDHPDDLQIDKLALTCIFLDPDAVYDVEKRYVRKDGRVIWVHVVSARVPDTGGRPISITATIEDITDRKEAEAALVQSRDELEKRVADRTAELRKRADQLAKLASELTLSEQRERHRLAKVLHDHLQQLLVAARFSLEVLRDRMPHDRQSSR